MDVPEDRSNATEKEADDIRRIALPKTIPIPHMMLCLTSLVIFVHQYGESGVYKMTP